MQPDQTHGSCSTLIVPVLLVISMILTCSAPAAAGAICQSSPGLFDYGPHRDDAEAEQLAMILTGSLRAPDAEYGRIRRDLALIRQAYPLLEAVVDDPDYVSDELIVDLDPLQTWDDYEATNQFYQVVDVDNLFGDTFVLTFCDNLHAPVLAAIYAALAEVNFAEPNGLIGTDDRITINVTGTAYRYAFEDGFLDCFDGCDCERSWLLQVDQDGTVELLSYNESGASYCDFDDTACCLGGSCAVTAIETCLTQGGSPRTFGTTCDGDADGDGLDAGCGDGCPADFDPSQADADSDGVGDVCDNCPTSPNADQLDSDSDMVGSLCDNCPLTANPEQLDGDIDGVGDLCDNCVELPNASQADLDGDLTGDRCDLDDGLIYIDFEDRDEVSWQDEVDFDAWNAYKGDLGVLADEGSYTQLPGSNPLAAAHCGLALPAAPDPAPPASGEVAFFLTTGIDGGVEGRLGADSEGSPRPNVNPCP